MFMIFYLVHAHTLFISACKPNSHTLTQASTSTRSIRVYYYIIWYKKNIFIYIFIYFLYAIISHHVESNQPEFPAFRYWRVPPPLPLPRNNKTKQSTARIAYINEQISIQIQRRFSLNYQFAFIPRSYFSISMLISSGVAVCVRFRLARTVLLMRTEKHEMQKLASLPWPWQGKKAHIKKSPRTHAVETVKIVFTFCIWFFSCSRCVCFFGVTVAVHMQKRPFWFGVLFFYAHFINFISEHQKKGLLFGCMGVMIIYRLAISVAFDETFEGFRHAFYAVPLASMAMLAANSTAIRWHYFFYYL